MQAEMLNTATICPRKFSIDLLRFFACISIILLHATGVPLHKDDVTLGAIDNAVLLILNFCGRYGVPLFVMITGALFLDEAKELSLKTLYTKYILRLFIAGGLWALFYGVFHYVVYDIPFKFFPLFNQEYHLWYVPMIIVVYMMLPVLRLIAKDHTLLLYMCIVWLIYVVLFFCNSFAEHKIADISYIKYCGYPLLAKLIIEYKPSKLIRRILAGLAVVGFIIACYLLVSSGNPDHPVTSNFSPVILVGSVALFAGFYSNEYSSLADKVKSFLVDFQKASYGIYLMHPFILLACYSSIINHMSSCALGCIIVTICVSVITYALATIIRRIPFLGKYVV